MSLLKKIIERKKERLASAKHAVPLSTLREMATHQDSPRDFTSAICGTGKDIRFIAEIKKASPSRGLLSPAFDQLRIAAIYEEKKADAVSVITEEDFFQGRLDFLSEIRKIVSRPLLRKDFLFDEYQFLEARAHGADAILLIAAILGKSQASEYLHMAKELGLAVLFEIHDHRELEMALNVGAPVIGINNRNLQNLSVDLETTFTLKKEIPHDRIVVSESGIKTRDDVEKMAEAGINALLIGSVLMESPDVGRTLDSLRGR